MKIQKYKAKITDSKKEVVGYLTEIREYIGNGVYGNGTDYLMSVTEKSMLSGDYGVFKVDKKTIKKFHECPICEINEVSNSKELFYSACSKNCYNKL